MVEEKLPLYDEISLQEIRNNLPVIQWDLNKVAIFVLVNLYEEQRASRQSSSISRPKDQPDTTPEKYS